MVVSIHNWRALIIHMLECGDVNVHGKCAYAGVGGLSSCFGWSDVNVHEKCKHLEASSLCGTWRRQEPVSSVFGSYRRFCPTYMDPFQVDLVKSD